MVSYNWCENKSEGIRCTYCNGAIPHGDQFIFVDFGHATMRFHGGCASRFATMLHKTQQKAPPPAGQLPLF